MSPGATRTIFDTAKRKVRSLSSNQMTWLFFGFSGRISRMAYLLAGLLMMLAVVFLAYRLTLAEEAGSSGVG